MAPRGPAPALLLFAMAQPTLAEHPFLAVDPDALRSALPEAPAGGPEPPVLVAYRDFYGLAFSGVKATTLRMKGRADLAVNVFVPERPKGTVFFFHGYLMHSAACGALYADLLSRGYAVVAPDLPGHGLSAGDRWAIDDFEDYASAVADVYAAFEGRVPAPHHALAHSTGAAAVTTYLQRGRNPFARIVFLAPLVRSVAWGWARFGLSVAGWLGSVPARQGGGTPDEAARRLDADDPLRGRVVPLRWAKALVRWNERAAAFPANDAPVVVVQGTRDSVVDGEWNRGWFEAHFPRVRWHVIPDGWHELHRERPAIRERALALVGAALEPGP